MKTLKQDNLDIIMKEQFFFLSHTDKDAISSWYNTSNLYFLYYKNKTFKTYNGDILYKSKDKIYPTLINVLKEINGLREDN